MDNNQFLNNNKWFLEIDLNGGRIVQLKRNNEKILGTFDRIDGKTGNTHVCAPNFANEGVEKFGLPFHGPFRNSEWNLINQTDDGLEIMCEINKLSVSQKFKISNNFEQEVKIKNVGKSLTPVNLGIHNYFECNVGWRGIIINGVDVTKIVEISDYIELKSINEIQIPGKESIIWKTEGFKFAKLWASLGDIKYVCVEPVRGKEGFMETKESLIKTGEILVFKQSFYF